MFLADKNIPNKRIEKNEAHILCLIHFFASLVALKNVFIKPRDNNRTNVPELLPQEHISQLVSQSQKRSVTAPSLP
jgi:hypothetical protein